MFLFGSRDNLRLIGPVLNQPFHRRYQFNHAEAQHLFDLEAGGEAGVQRGDGFLEDHGDLAPDQLAPLVAAVGAHYGQIDILLNCAGTNQRMPIAAVTPAVYNTIMDTNLRSAYFLSQAALPLLIKAGGGKIVNVGSLTSAVGLADVSVYGMSKSALAQLTKTMAIEWALQNIQVNCLCPGFIATELTAPLWQDPVRSRWMLDRILMKRAGQPDDLTGLAIMLSSRASDYITGQSIYVDGGFTVGSQW